MSYKIIRFFASDDRPHVVTLTGLTLAQARKHCGHPETSSSTCTRPDLRALTERVGDWFDGYDKE